MTVDTAKRSFGISLVRVIAVESLTGVGLLGPLDPRGASSVGTGHWLGPNFSTQFSEAAELN